MIRCPFCDNKNPPDTTYCTKCGAELPRTLETGGESLSDAVAALLARGQKIEAIRLYRERTGAGLKEAKDAVETLERGAPLPMPAREAATADPDVLNLIRAGKKIDAIKRYRERTGLGLAEAKQAVEDLARSQGLPTSGSGCSTAVLLLAIAACVFLLAIR